MAILLLHWQTIKVMDREKEIKQEASEYTKNYDCFYGDTVGYQSDIKYWMEIPELPTELE